MKKENQKKSLIELRGLIKSKEKIELSIARQKIKEAKLKALHEKGFAVDLISTNKAFDIYQMENLGIDSKTIDTLMFSPKQRQEADKNKL
jgi:hypothetical protein